MTATSKVAIRCPEASLRPVYGSPNPRVEEHEQTQVTVRVEPAPYYEDKRKTTDYSAD